MPGRRERQPSMRSEGADRERAARDAAARSEMTSASAVPAPRPDAASRGATRRPRLGRRPQRGGRAPRRPCGGGRTRARSRDHRRVPPSRTHAAARREPSRAPATPPLRSQSGDRPACRETGPVRRGTMDKTVIRARTSDSRSHRTSAAVVPRPAVQTPIRPPSASRPDCGVPARTRALRGRAPTSA